MAASKPLTPGQIAVDHWSGTSAMSSNWPVSCEVVFDADLPNGPYGEMSMGAAGKIHVPPGSDYNVVAQALLAAWIKGRGAMTNMQFKGAGMRGFEMKEEWRVISIEYKGGPVNQEGVANEGNHNVQLGIIQRAGPMASPAPACCVIA